MKKNLLVFMTLWAINAGAQDVIVKKDGSTIVSKVLEISGTEIKYKKFTNLEGPTYTLSQADIQLINYENGEKEVFDAPNESVSAAHTETEGVIHKALPAADNEEEKAQYAYLPKMTLKQSEKISKNFFPIMAFTDSSVISTKELTIVMMPWQVTYFEDGWFKAKLAYAIQIVNKTDGPLYIDRANSFRRFNNHETKSYYDNKQYVVTNSTSRGVGMGVNLIGPVGLGGNKSSSTSSSENFGVDRFLIIGPQSKANLLDFQNIRTSQHKLRFQLVSDLERWEFDLKPEYSVKQGEVREFTETDTPYSNKYFITYATDPEFKDCQSVNFELYTRYVVGAKMKSWKKWSTFPINNNLNKIPSEVQKFIPDFWVKNLSIIIGTPGEFK